MHTTSLRKVGGSVMMTVPPAILDLLNLHAGSTVAISLDAGRLVVDPNPQPHYTLGELLSQCDAAAERTEEDREWLADEPVGSELL